MNWPVGKYLFTESGTSSKCLHSLVGNIKQSHLRISENVLSVGKPQARDGGGIFHDTYFT